MASISSITVCVLWILYADYHHVGASQLDNCQSVAEYYNKHVGAFDTVPPTPISDAGLGVCGHTLRFTDYKSCCNAEMESQFLETSVTYLRDHIQMTNAKLRDRITLSLRLYQDHIKSSMMESRNQTAAVLQHPYRIPREAFGKTLDALYTGLGAFLHGEARSLDHIVDTFFKDLFTHVFEYLLSDPRKFRAMGDDFRQCLTDSYREIKPFGRFPATIVKVMRNAFERSRLFSESLRVLLGIIESSDSLDMDSHCKRAVTKLQFCSMCSGAIEQRPCRGLCLNVMRGCLAYVKDLSPAWDDLVEQFEDLQRGMFQKKTAHDVLAAFDGNLNAAISRIMEKITSVYKQVIQECQPRSNSTVEQKHFSTAEGREMPPSRHSPGDRLQAIREDIEGLVLQLQDSKGFIHRVADDLCRREVLYDPVMDSATCWNGSAVGRYLHMVPEANTVSQAKNNVEVQITLRGKKHVVEQKNRLEQMRRRLTALFDGEAMQQDEAYQRTINADPSSGYGGSSQLVDLNINDDEDYNYYDYDGLSGSGSGYSSEEGEDGNEDSQTPTSGRGSNGGAVSGTGKGSVGGRGNNRGSSKSGPDNAGTQPSASAGATLWVFLGTMVVARCFLL